MTDTARAHIASMSLNTLDGELTASLRREVAMIVMKRSPEKEVT